MFAIENTPKNIYINIFPFREENKSPNKKTAKQIIIEKNKNIIDIAKLYFLFLMNNPKRASNKIIAPIIIGNNPNPFTDKIMMDIIIQYNK